MRMKTVLIGLGFLTAALGQDTGPQRQTIPFRNATAPRKLIVSGVSGRISIKGYDGKDAIVDYTGHATVFSGGRSSTPPPAGMRRISPDRNALGVNEQDNVIRLNGGFVRASDLTIQVPVETSVTVNTLGGDSIEIETISGEIEASTMSGAVTITNSSGSVVAHSMSGKITVALNKVTPDKSMSFSTMNGDIEVTLPADTKARLKMRTYNGDVFTDTDFDVKAEPGDTSAQETVTTRKGKTKVFRYRRHDGSTYATVNGGGPDFQFTTFNGRILIHKK
jgi:DUF4097 and DUF4098 domain-containing protein YvlB